ncbi:unnamed protein product [Absidia cylindrospora]
MSTLLSIVLFCLLLVSSVSGSLYARDYQRRLYYTMYIPNGNHAAAMHVAHQLKARYEGPVGELQQYHEISTLKSPPPLPPRGQSLDKRHNQDIDEYTEAHHALLKRFRQLQQHQIARRDTTSSFILQIDSLKPQIRHRRLVKRAPPSLDYIHGHYRLTSRQKKDDATTTSDNDDDNDDDDDEEETDSAVIPQQHYLDPISSKHFLNMTDGFKNLKQALNIDDPGFDRQWHLVNQDQYGHDLNVTGVWSQGITGKNIVVAILDDGLDMNNDDLTTNFFAEGSYDFNDHTSLPKPRLAEDTHGTRCAGEIAAVKNGVCGVGMAYDAKVAGIRILSADITDEDEARALNYKYQENHIYSCSWGPPDYGEVAEAPQGIVLDAIKNGIDKGRNGTGTIYVFASGNGGGNDDNCNFDGYTNSIYTITVGAVDRMGNHPYYSERCSAQLVVAYSSGSGGNIYTTDAGQNKCTDRHGGTSAAAPLAAGVFALVLSVRPDLTWRDMQYLCVQTAVPLSLDDGDWTLLPSGRKYNHKFGYGKLDAYAIVEAAKTFEKVGPQTYLQVSARRNKRRIPDRSVDPDQDLTDTITITQDMVDGAGLARLEHITATVYIEHDRRGDLEVLLESPQNVSSQLGAPRKYDVSAAGLIDWTFMTVKHWDEDPVGEWTLRVIDWKNSQFTGSFTNWTLTLYGERVEEVDGEIIHIPTTTTTTLNVIAPTLSSDSQNIPDSSSSLSTEPSIATSVPSIISLDPTSAPTTPTSASATTIMQADDDSFAGEMNDTMSLSSEPDGHGSSTGTRFFYVMMAGITVTGLLWMIRRRIKGPQSAKDTTTYTNVPQYQQPHDPFMHEYGMSYQDHPSQHLPSETINDDQHKYDGDGKGR